VFAYPRAVPPLDANSSPFSPITIFAILSPLYGRKAETFLFNYFAINEKAIEAVCGAGRAGQSGHAIASHPVTLAHKRGEAK
jgi:hypothetical protein